jgi:CorA-like Mg2+ transporter protein/Amidase
LIADRRVTGDRIRHRVASFWHGYYDIPIEAAGQWSKQERHVVWIGLFEPSEELLRRVQVQLDLHPLAIEDAAKPHQQPKLEQYGKALFIVARTAQMAGEEISFGETHIFLGRGYLVSVRHGASTSYAAVRERCEACPTVLAHGEDYILYAILDFIVDKEGVNIAEIDQIPPSKLACDRFKYDINAYLAHLGPPAPKNLDDIIASQKFHPSILKYLLASQAEAGPDQNPQCQAAAANRLRLAQGLLKTMDDARLDALVYPTSNYPPRLIGDLNTPHGNNSPRLAPFTGFPALTVPMGYARGVLPVGLQILGRARAQQAGRVRRFGVLMNADATETEFQSTLAAFTQGLRQLGWTE